MMEHAELIRHWAAMVRAAESIVGSRQDAEDCAAACHAELCEKPPLRADNLEALLVTVAKRRAVDLVRTRCAERRRDGRLASRASLTEHDVAEEVVNRAEARWFDSAARRTLRPHVYALLERLAADVSIDQAAAELGMSRRAAESHLLRARRTLREVLPKAMASVVVLFGAFRRLGSRSAAPALTAVSAACLLVLPAVSGVFSGGEAPQRALAPPHAHERPATALELLAGGQEPPLTREKPARSARRAPAESKRSPIVTVHGPGRSEVFVRHGDTGGHERGPVEVLLACVDDFQISPQRIGCAG
jgi:DNA-directed RNA polymerase specialized sigma24 family protein